MNSGRWKLQQHAGRRPGRVRRATLYVVTAVAALVSACLFPSDPFDSLDLSVSTDKDDILSGETVTVAVTLTNISAEAQTVVRECPFLWYELHDAGGNELTGGQVCSRPASTPEVTLTLEPGASHSDTLRWTPAPRFTSHRVERWEPGVYEIVGAARIRGSERRTPSVPVRLRCQDPSWTEC